MEERELKILLKHVFDKGLDCGIHMILNLSSKNFVSSEKVFESIFDEYLKAKEIAKQILKNGQQSFPEIFPPE
jgi:hypothetical protein